jgi:hypothetical protein
MKELTTAAAPSAPSPAPAHLFRSADGSKTFKGQLQSYDAATKIVTVQRKNGTLIRFELSKLHPDDQAFVTSDATDGEP